VRAEQLILVPQSRRSDAQLGTASRCWLPFSRSGAKLRWNAIYARFNREIGRRTDVVGIFPDDASLVRLVSMLAIEANDEWLVGRSYISLGSMATLYDTRSDGSLSFESEEEVAELAAA
jgi:hypothetical protein